jgi:spermidine/putrescine-binding protein
MKINKKLFLKTSSVVASLALVTSIFSIYFVRQSEYSFKMTSFSDYFSGENIRGFDDQYEKKVKLNEFNNNEAMLTKTITTSYDTYVSTDYSINALYNNDIIQPIDYSKLESYNTDLTNQSFLESSTDRRFIDE